MLVSWLRCILQKSDPFKWTGEKATAGLVGGFEAKYASVLFPAQKDERSAVSRRGQPGNKENWEGGIKQGRGLQGLHAESNEKAPGRVG